MKKLLIFFLIVGKTSFGQNCAFINIYETLEYLPNYESEFNSMKSKLQHFDDSMNVIRQDFYSKILRIECAVGITDSARINQHREKNKNLLKEFEEFNEVYLEMLRLLYDKLNMVFLINLMYIAEIEIIEFAKTKNVDCISDSDYIYFCENPVDYTEDFIQYLLCKYEYD